jgi:hypothetical protein
MCWDKFDDIIAELKSPHIRLYIHGFADEMGEDLDNIVKVFRFFNKYGTQRTSVSSRAANHGEQECPQ